jgi:antitoxin VapB
MRTRIFKSGNSLAVCIPRELAFGGTAGDAEIERPADCLIVRPVCKRTLSGLLAKFAAFPPEFMAEGREQREETEQLGW